jgi:hypothetical protein
MSTSIVLATLDRIWNILVPLGYPMAVMGGISLAAWKHIRATRDVDLLIAVDQGTIDNVLTTLADQFRPKRLPPIIAVGEHHFVQLLHTPQDEFYDVQVDLLLAESDLQKSALSRRVSYDLPGISQSIDVLHCDDLILLKLVSGLVLDLADVAMLLRENRDVIDFRYLRHWMSQLGLRSEYTAAWSSAFPGETEP